MQPELSLRRRVRRVVLANWQYKLLAGLAAVLVYGWVHRPGGAAATPRTAPEPECTCPAEP